MYIGDTLYKKGQLVVSIKTDDSGVGKIGDLPYGSYYVKRKSVLQLRRVETAITSYYLMILSM